MPFRSFLTGVVMFAFQAAPMPAQVPMPWRAPTPAPVPLPGHGLAPLLYVRVSGPPGTHAAFFQGRAPARGFNAPVTVGLRPGYIYRIELTGFAGRPGVSLAPTLQVCNTLALTPCLHPANYPAPVELTEADIEQALAGSLITKVIYLENPDLAVPVATRKGEALETVVPPDRDLLAEARERGRPMLVVRLGGRIVSTEELAAESVPGTILLPGERSLGLPAAQPILPWHCVAFYDPRIGPKPPTEECLHDGGDRGAPGGFDGDGRLRGLDPEDTIAEYTDSAGRRSLTHSNRVCLCVPRFAALRSELPLGRYENFVRLDDARLTLGQDLLKARLPATLAMQSDRLQGLQGRERPSGTINAKGPAQLLRFEMLQGRILELGPEAAIGTKQALQLTQEERLRLAQRLELARLFTSREGVQGTEQFRGPAIIGRIEGAPELVRATAEVRDITVCCNEPPCPPDKPLHLFKWADRQCAEVGDVVTFTLKYSNVGGRPIADVAVNDSLSPRLEYVPGSAQADRDAVFTAQPNEAGSVVLRWEISGRLLPGQSGVVRFQAKVR
jgi:uncharacterized repeat protein (TIGR01451 family)